MKSEDRKKVMNAVISVTANVFDDLLKHHKEDDSIPLPSPMVVFVSVIGVDVTTFNVWGNLSNEDQKTVIDRFYIQSMAKLKNYK
ncbi:hypothetical protein AB0X79_07680 [Pediococcus pentosaceus]|uniref:hypothetical protein n=1 Tax=Pediococcus pentosaceus TaxID=1255 RepID=UPI003F214727